jgi:general secretion pathway protein A
MYIDFYGLRELPFELTPNPRFLLLTPRQREALANLQYGITARKPVTILVGEAGTGKTTLLHAVLNGEACRGAHLLHVTNPTLSRSDFLEALARGFGLSPSAESSKSTLIAELEGVLRSRHSQSMTTALVVDEAQALSLELLEEVRLLSNLETTTAKLLPIVLAGQPELADRLNDSTQRQLKQRVALRCTLSLLDVAETAAYIAGRLRVAGHVGGSIFTSDAVSVVHARSRGVPRTISVICDNALVNGYAAGEKTIGPGIVNSVCDDFDLGVVGLRSPPVAPRRHSPASSGVPADARQPQGNLANRLFASFTAERKRGFSFF